jgi:hypothetical protein
MNECAGMGYVFAGECCADPRLAAAAAAGGALVGQAVLHAISSAVVKITSSNSPASNTLNQTSTDVGNRVAGMAGIPCCIRGARDLLLGFSGDFPASGRTRRSSSPMPGWWG